MLFHQYSWNSGVETTWISLIGWHHKTSKITYLDLLWPSLSFLSLPPLLLFLDETLYLSLATMMQQSWCSTWIMHPGKLASHGWLPPGGLDFGLVCVCLFRCNSPPFMNRTRWLTFLLFFTSGVSQFLSIQCRQIKKIENDIMFGKSFKAGNA